jgi:hypothetical protein
MMKFIRPLVLLALAALAACGGDSTAPTQIQKPTSDLHFIRLSTGAPPLEATTISFYAVKGQDREVRLQLRDGSDFLRFRVFANSLDKRPDGTAIAPGDSILITITVPDPTTFAADFQPAGLKFSAPARLQFEFADCDKDLNGDGVVTAADTALIPQISTWRQETLAAPWVKIASTVEIEINEVQADISGFSGYALAY